MREGLSVLRPPFKSPFLHILSNHPFTSTVLSQIVPQNPSLRIRKLHAREQWYFQRLKSKYNSVSTQSQKRSDQTFLSVRHAPGLNPQSLDILSSATIGMEFAPPYSLHVRPRHVQVIISRPRGDHCVLTILTEYYDSSALRSRLRHVRGAPARLRGARIVMPRAAVSTPTCHVNPPPRPAR